MAVILTCSIRQELLSAKGRFYLVAIAQNNVQSILSRVREASRNLEGTVCIFSSSFMPNPTFHSSWVLDHPIPPSWT